MAGDDGEPCREYVVEVDRTCGGLVNRTGWECCKSGQKHTNQLYKSCYEILRKGDWVLVSKIGHDLDGHVPLDIFASKYILNADDMWLLDPLGIFPLDRTCLDVEILWNTVFLFVVLGFHACPNENRMGMGRVTLLSFCSHQNSWYVFFHPPNMVETCIGPIGNDSFRYKQKFDGSRPGLDSWMGWTMVRWSTAFSHSSYSGISHCHATF